MAYELQMQYMKQEQGQSQRPTQRVSQSYPQNSQQSYQPNYQQSYPQSQPQAQARPNQPLGSHDPNLPDYGYHYNKKPGFYKKLKRRLLFLIKK